MRGPGFLERGSSVAREMVQRVGPIAGEPLVSRHRECRRGEECNYDEQWVQHDRFVVPER